MPEGSCQPWQRRRWHGQDAGPRCEHGAWGGWPGWLRWRRWRGCGWHLGCGERAGHCREWGRPRGSARHHSIRSIGRGGVHTGTTTGDDGNGHAHVLLREHAARDYGEQARGVAWHGSLWCLCVARAPTQRCHDSARATHTRSAARTCSQRVARRGLSGHCDERTVVSDAAGSEHPTHNCLVSGYGFSSVCPLGPFKDELSECPSRQIPIPRKTM